LISEHKQNFYVKKGLNSICSSYKVIESLQKIWTKSLNSYGLVLQSQASKC